MRTFGTWGSAEPLVSRLSGDPRAPVKSRFAELTGMSPTAYRKQAAERGGPAPIPGCFALMWRASLPKPRSAERITS